MRRGFTLLEVLVAGGVLFIVSSAVVGLSNSIIQGTGRTADRTVVNRWASEGLELTAKLRTDSVKVGGTDSIVTGEKIWFPPAADYQSTYGWYLLKEPDNQLANWTLVPLTTTVQLSLNSFPALFQARDILPLNSQGLEAYRVICIEAYRATALRAPDGYAECNRADTQDLTRAKDGFRNIITDCQPPDDLYCTISKDSLNRNSGQQERIVPPGNVIKVRSVIVWQDRTNWEVADMGTLFTNWKGSEQD